MIYLFLILSFLVSACFAQDGISPDTMYNIRSGVFVYTSQNPASWCADTSAYDTSAFYGIYDTTGGGSIKWKSNEVGAFFDDSFIIPIAASSYAPVSDYYQIQRLFTLFDTRTIAGMTSMEKIDSVFVRFELMAVDSTDGDSLFVVKFIPRQDSTPYATAITDHDELVNRCNFYQCSTEVWIDGDASHWGRYGVDLSIGWNNIKLETGYIQEGDTTGIGFVTRLTCDTAPGTWPTGVNAYIFDHAALQVDTAAFQLVYYYSPKYNDISHQNSADGISPDTLQFICSGDNDSIWTPAYWQKRYIPAWNNGPDPVIQDAFHGRIGSGIYGAYGCSTSWYSNHLGWKRAEPGSSHPMVSATKRFPTYNDYWVDRAYFLLEIEQGIPDATEIDSATMHIQFASVDLADGDSIFIVPYTPYYSNTGIDSCYQCYGCQYPNIGAGGTRGWCNFWKCNGHEIWGGRDEAGEGIVPVYLGWKQFPVPDFIDFSSTGVGDTFGVGFVMRFEDREAPTDTNQVAIMVDPCPYIVYYFSKPKADGEGFINWGLRPSHLGWGLPVNQARKCYGGGRRP